MSQARRSVAPGGRMVRVDRIGNPAPGTTVTSGAGQELSRLASRKVARDYEHFVFSEKNEMPGFHWANCVGPDGPVRVHDRDRG